MQITLVASQNGFGHARRTYELGKIFNDKKIKVKILLSKQQINLIKMEPLSKNLDFFIASESFGIDGYVKNKSVTKITNDTKKIIESSDAIICDNLLWPAEYNSNVYVHGHFVWQQVLTDLDADILQNELYLLQRARTWFRNHNFKLDKKTLCQNNTEIVEVGCMRYELDYLLSNLPVKKNEIWICGGTLIENKKSIKDLGLSAQNFIVKYFETYQMMNLGYKPKFVMGRPGFGTIRDCLAAGVQFFPLKVNFDFEMQSNVENMIKLKILPKNYFEILTKAPQIEVLDSIAISSSNTLEIWDAISVSLDIYSKQLLEKMVV